MNHVESGASLVRLVRLQVPHEVPLEGEVRGAVHLSQRFLHLVLTEIDLTGVGSHPDVSVVERLRDGHELDRVRVPSHSTSRLRDSLTNGSEPDSERCGIEHAWGATSSAG